MGASTRKMAAMRTNMGIMIGTWEEKRGMCFLHITCINLKSMLIV